MQSGPKRELGELGELSFTRAYEGQLTPMLPDKGAAATQNGPVLMRHNVLWQRGPYGSWWLRTGLADAGGLPSQPELGAALDEVLSHAAGAIYVGVPELSAEPGTTALLRGRGFRYHHYHAAAEGPSAGGEHIYYRWMGDPAHDMVPACSTSIEGVCALILSPDESKILLAWEYGSWKAITGAVDTGESTLDALAREVREEVGCALDPSFRPVCVGGWQKARARDATVNDNFHAYVVRAASESFAVDAQEIAEAKWFNVAAIIDEYRRLGEPSSGMFDAPAGALLAADGDSGPRPLRSVDMGWLLTHLEGGGLGTLVQEKGVAKLTQIGRKQKAQGQPAD